MTPDMADCSGLWRRTLLIDADGSRDTATDVRWLQGITAFVDLRRPWLRTDTSGYDGFAGWLSQRDDIFEWDRFAGLQPAGPHPDAGRMSWDETTLVEAGVHSDYVEHWVRDESPIMPCWALTLCGVGRGALLMRVGDVFGWAHQAPAGVEISLGVLEGTDWVVTDSSLPEREGLSLHPRLAGNQLRIDGVDVAARHWIVKESEGSVTL